MRRILLVISVALLTFSFTDVASAKHYRHRHHAVTHHHFKHAHYVKRRGNYGQVLNYLPHPSGCPPIVFCGCGAAVDLFGHSIRSLWLARNWYRFPRTYAASEMVGVRPHHVLILESPVEGGRWIVRSYNSGGHQSRRMIMSIAGYTIVNPHGNRYARL